MPLDGAAEYRLVGILGKGGTGVVYQAHQRAVDREVAVKVLRDEFINDPSARRQFLTEATTIGGLDHPNVIAIHEVGCDEQGRLFYSMKRVDGTAWSMVIDQRSTSDNLQTLLRVSDAVAYANSRGLIHRDLKPENVMLGPFGEVLVADWGLAVPHPLPVLDDDSLVSIGGTPAYMAPELACGDLESIGPHTDVYLLGAVLYRILTGTPPHAGRNVIECLQAAADNRIQPTEVQGELMEIALRAMSFDPAERFPDATSFQNAVQDFLHHQESTGLVDRGKQILRKGESATGYESFGLALSLFQEALDIWPENRRATRFMRETRLAFARRAADQGDLDLAVSMIEAAGAQDSEVAQRIDELRQSRSEKCTQATRFASLFEHSPDGVILSRLEDGLVLEANVELLELIGYQREQVVGQSVLELNFWESPRQRQRMVREVLRAGRIDNIELSYSRKDGRHLWLLLSTRLMEFEGQRLLVTHVRDNSERKTAELQLQRSRQRMRQVQELAHLGMWELDLASGTLTWGDLAIRILSDSCRSTEICGTLPESASDPSQWSGEPTTSIARTTTVDQWAELLHPDDRERLRKALRGAMENSAAFQIDLRIRRRDQSYNRIRMRGQPIIEDDQTVELFGTIIDVPDRVPMSVGPLVADQSVAHPFRPS
jgi:hypothetical protein